MWSKYHKYISIIVADGFSESDIENQLYGNNQQGSSSDDTFKYYTKNHHEAIISEEEWNKAQEILKSRYRTNENVSETERIKFARKYAFSSMCKCGFCGTNLTRRSHHQDTQHKKPVWKCRTATNKGI